MLKKADPFASILAQAANLPTTSASLDRYAHRIESSQRLNADSFILLDTSESMKELIGKRRKIEILREAIKSINLTDKILIAFASYPQKCSPDSIPDPAGNTALHLALQSIQRYSPAQTLVICDGYPDCEDQALKEASKLSGIISTLFVGADNDLDAIAFMARLAKLGCGRAVANDVSKFSDPKRLRAKIVNLLPGT